MIKPMVAMAAATALMLTALPVVADSGGAARPPVFTPGSAGLGDPYFPLDGNGGYDVRHYLLDVKYDPATDLLRGIETISARATQNLSSFNLDLIGLNVRSIKVNGVAATFSRDANELTVVPRRGLPDRTPFTITIRYDGVAGPVDEAALGLSGLFNTDDGVLVAGQPHGAATWYPVNDSPLDTASYTFRITVPEGLQALANGRLTSTKSHGGWTTWKWHAAAPMASYLTTIDIGEFQIDAYTANGIKFWDGIDPDLFDAVIVPHGGDQMALSLQASPAHKRLTRTIPVPDVDSPTLSFWAVRDTEPGWDFFAVEARTPGGDDWTTLPEASGITSDETGNSCPDWLAYHPFLTHYQTENADGTCSPVGTAPSTGVWNAISGASDGYEQWVVDLSAYRGTDVEISLSSISDSSVQLNGVAIDDIVVTGGVGSTGFEDDGDEMDGWTVPGAPADAAVPNENDWIVGTAADGPVPAGVVAAGSLGRQPEILEFLEGYFGEYPFGEAGGIVDDQPDLGFALETQTRPVYAAEFFTDSVSGDAVVVHENAHQWFGDDLPLADWASIWLNEGFATYAEWLWSDHEGLGSPQEISDFYMDVIPADDPFWTVPIGDPGPDSLFDGAVYLRGALTLHALRLEVGDATFLRIVRQWAAKKSGQNVTTAHFVRFAEHVAHRQLDDFFQTWLFDPTKPAVEPTAVARTQVATNPMPLGKAFAQRSATPHRG